MQKPLFDFFKDLPERQRNEILRYVESLPADVQSIVFPKVESFNVGSTVDTPLATYWVDLDAFDVLRNINQLNIDISKYFSYYTLPEILNLLKGQRPEDYQSILTPLAVKGVQTVKKTLEAYSLLQQLNELCETVKQYLPD